MKRAKESCCGVRRMNDFERCIEERRIQRIEISGELVRKEIDAAEDDLQWAKQTMSGTNYKWASVQAYYSMFHAAKALLFSKGTGKRAITACWLQSGNCSSWPGKWNPNLPTASKCAWT